MQNKQFPNGHYYDAEKNAQCPYCGGDGVGVTRPLDGGESFAGTAPAVSAPDFPRTAPISGAFHSAETAGAIPKTAPVVGGQYGKTINVNLNEDNIDPVRGWLVCVEGKKKGKDFRIQSERNSIGRAKSNKVVLDFDEAVTRESHAVLSYDKKSNTFWIVMDKGESNIYLNDTIVHTPTQLNPYDIIEIGKTKLSFVPFCTDTFQW